MGIYYLDIVNCLYYLEEFVDLNYLYLGFYYLNKVNYMCYLDFVDMVVDIDFYYPDLNYLY